MVPILGTMLGIVLNDLANTLMSVTFTLLGIICAVGMGFVFSLFVDESSISPENNSQVAGRISPRLLDLIGALATGAVASVALVRKDIAGSLPGVSIAISLVPPLNVVGVCLRLRDYSAASGAMILFVTNYLWYVPGILLFRQDQCLPLMSRPIPSSNVSIVVIVPTSASWW